MDPEKLCNLGRAAYEAYRAYSGGLSLATGQPIPDWDELPIVIQAAWQASAEAVAAQV